MKRVTRLVTTLMSVAVLASCSNPADQHARISPVSNQLPVTVLSKIGPNLAGGRQNLFAAPALVDLQGLAFGYWSNPNFYDCRRSQAPFFRNMCWLDIKDPGNAMLVGAYVDDLCADSTFSATLSAPHEVTITVAYRPTPRPPFLQGPAQSLKPGQCPQEPTQALLSLLAIPLTALPADELTIKLVHPGVDLPAWKTMVDLKRPLNISNDLDSAIGRVGAALKLASSDAASRASLGGSASILWFGTGRWPDTGLGCPVSGQRYEAVTSMGYVIVMKGADQSSATEYHVSRNLLRFCGPAT